MSYPTRVFTLTLLLTVGIGTAHAALPVTFEENRGQVAPDVRFLSHTSSFELFLTNEGAVIQLPGGHAVRIDLVNSSRTAPVATRPLFAKTNYVLAARV